MKRILKLAAPYIAVGVFWSIFHNAWLAILAYHAQILIWSPRPFSGFSRLESEKTLIMALPFAAAGPILYFMLPTATHTDLSSWLAQHHLLRLPLVFMIPYFGLVHPVLEQAHWASLREDTPVAHLMFAGYHMLVLYSLFSTPWLVSCFVILATVSFIWRKMAKRSNSLLVPLTSHILANMGIIIAAWMRS